MTPVQNPPKRQHGVLLTPEQLETLLAQGSFRPIPGAAFSSNRVGSYISITLAQLSEPPVYGVPINWDWTLTVVVFIGLARIDNRWQLVNEIV